MKKEIKIRPADIEDVDSILNAINEKQLDDTDFDYHQFIIAELTGEFAGFGRIKEYNDAKELCSLGVLSKYRGRGISRLLIKE